MKSLVKNLLITGASLLAVSCSTPDYPQTQPWVFVNKGITDKEIVSRQDVLNVAKTNKGWKVYSVIDNSGKEVGVYTEGIMSANKEGTYFRGAEFSTAIQFFDDSPLGGPFYPKSLGYTSSEITR